MKASGFCLVAVINIVNLLIVVTSHCCVQIQIKKYRGNRGCKKALTGEETCGACKSRVWHSLKFQCRLFSTWQGLC